MMSAKLLTFKVSCADFDRLENLAIQCDIASKTGTLFEKTSTDMQFHLAFVECTRNPILYSYQKQLCYRVQLIQMNSTFSKEEDIEFVDYHKQIVKYMRKRDLSSTYTMIEDHFYKFYKLYKQYPPKFFQLFDTIDFW